ncbi:heat-shock protein Hsp20 [Microvirga vignae]|uniref:Heat-shock protein Hsp20 n=2 Tax=Microvirga vignae TaxID=1225564 RepID=A0A0H1RCZ9_9HYPH|nr:heat-shock protein Hsp20 [Microvirga vignae]
MRDPADWMLSEAIEALARAERLHRQMFQPPSATRRAAWEPPVDVIETEQEVLILIALPGVAPDQVETVIEDGTLVVAGRRVLPPQLRTAVIHRLELPQGRFERRIPLPPGHYDAVRRAAGDGCLVISLRKAP